MNSILSLKILCSTYFSAALLTRTGTSAEQCRAQLLFLETAKIRNVLTKNSLPISVIFQILSPSLNQPFLDITILCHICMSKCLFPSQICLMSKPGDQRGRVTATPALSQKVKTPAQLGKRGLDSKGNYRSSGGVLSVHFWKANCTGSSGRCHWAATSLLKFKIKQVNHHKALKSFFVSFKSCCVHPGAEDSRSSRPGDRSQVW